MQPARRAGSAGINVDGREAGHRSPSCGACCAAIAGLIESAGIKGADCNNAGLMIEMDAILAVAIGGTSLAGGRFSIPASIVGALIIQSITTSVYAMGVAPEVTQVVKALIVVCDLPGAVEEVQGRRRGQADLPEGGERGVSTLEKTRRRGGIKNVSLFITVILFVGLFAAGSVRYDRFLSLSTFLNLFNDNAYLIIVSVGITFVLLTGGIDISVASTLAFTCVFSAFLLRLGVPAFVVIPLVLLIGLGVGALMGFLIHSYDLQPFIVTLAGQFFMRGLCAVISTESIPISDGFYKSMALGKVAFGKAKLYYYVFIALAVVALAYYVLKYTKFGRGVYAVGGGEQSAVLMGLPVARTKISVYAISGFCAALAGVVFSFYTLAGYSLQNMGLELDAISSAVIGGTLLTGGVGTVIGTMFGVLIQGVIQTIVTYQNLNTWWTKVTIAALLCVFIVIQRIIAIRAEKLKNKG